MYGRIVVDDDFELYAELVVDCAAQVHRRAPKSLDLEADELASEFFSTDRAAVVLASAHDDDSLRALTTTALKNLVRDRLRSSDRGRLARRLGEILRSEGFVQHPTTFWTRDARVAPFAGPTHALEAATWAVDVRVTRWRPDARRNTPVADRASIVELVDTILDTAGAPVEFATLVELIAKRLSVGPPPVFQSIDAVDEWNVAVDTTIGVDPEWIVIDGDDALDDALIAVGLWGLLSDAERSVLPFRHESARTVAERLSIGKTKAGNDLKRLKEKLATELGPLTADRRLRVLEEIDELA